MTNRTNPPVTAATGSRRSRAADEGPRVEPPGTVEAMARDGSPRDTTAPDTVADARTAGLRYWSDDRPAIERRRSGRGFRYLDPDGRTIRAPEVLERIRRLAIPPAWTTVRICPDPAGHLQATGRDARGRKQYRYHAAFRSHREAAKFDRLAAFGRALPELRARVEADLERVGLPREKVLAGIVRLLELTLVRVGNEEYARLNRSFGLTTLRGRHATVRGGSVRFRFRGKGGKAHEVGLRNRRLAHLVARCQDLPGQDLFQYLDDEGEPHAISSEDVNEYLRDASGIDVTAKTFRTWAATVLACRALVSGAAGSQAESGAGSRAGRGRGSRTGARQEARGSRASSPVTAAMRDVAEQLGNTPAVARRSYVHPAIVDAYLDGVIGRAFARTGRGSGDATGQARGSVAAAPALGLPTAAEEAAVIRLLEDSTAAAAQTAARTRTGASAGSAAPSAARA